MQAQLYVMYRDEVSSRDGHNQMTALEYVPSHGKSHLNASPGQRTAPNNTMNLTQRRAIVLACTPKLQGQKIDRVKHHGDSNSGNRLTFNKWRGLEQALSHIREEDQVQTMPRMLPPLILETTVRVLTQE